MEYCRLARQTGFRAADTVHAFLQIQRNTVAESFSKIFLNTKIFYPDLGKKIGADQVCNDLAMRNTGL
jgi:hypothetical protein